MKMKEKQNSQPGFLKSTGFFSGFFPETYNNLSESPAAAPKVSCA
jgi:hypothetical protein